MNERDRTFWDAVGGVLTLVVLGVLGYALYRTATTFVAVPVLWPLAASAGVLVLGYRELDWRARYHRESVERAEREREAVHRWADAPSVAEILRNVRYSDEHAGDRIGDAERDVIVSALHHHFGAGRLDAAELDERLTRTLAAKRRADLRDALRDLPDERTGR